MNWPDWRRVLAVWKDWAREVHAFVQQQQGRNLPWRGMADCRIRLHALRCACHVNGSLL